MPVLLLSNAYTPDRMDELWEAGATQILVKANSTPKLILAAVRTALRGVHDDGGKQPAIKLLVDRDRRAGRFLLTGSADLLLPAVSASLAGRMQVVPLHPLTRAASRSE